MAQLMTLYMNFYSYNFKQVLYDWRVRFGCIHKSQLVSYKLTVNQHRHT